MKTEVKAEFHDIGKLIDWQAAGLFTPGDKGGEPHEFERCVESEVARKEWGVELNGAAWEAIVRKDAFQKERMSAWPMSAGWVIVSLADEVVSGYGRNQCDKDALQKCFDQRRESPGVYRLWSGTSSSDPCYKTSDKVKEIIAWLNDDPSWDEASKKFSEQLRARAEDKFPGLNVTSLYQHCQTVGQIGRILSKFDWTHVNQHDNWDTAKQKAQTHTLIVAHYLLDFPQKPYRVRDLNVFQLVQDILHRLKTEFPDNVLTTFENQAIVVFADNEEERKWQQQIWAAGLTARYKRHAKNLVEHAARGIVNFGNQDLVHAYSDNLPSTIQLPICENCQMERASRQWPKDHDPSRVDEPNEDLCERCFSLRKRGEPLKKLSEEWREGTVAWIHAPLDFEDARKALTQLHRHYLKSVAPSCPNEILEKLEATFPLIADFIEAYKTFLDDFDRSLRVWLAEDNVEERVSDALWCVRLKSKNEATKLVSDIFCLLREHFPKLLEREFSAAMPIKIGISISNPKHPFFSHWEAIENPEKEIAIQLVGSGRAAFCLKHTPKVLESLKSVTPSAVHRLAAVAGISESLANLVMKDNSERGMDMTALGRLVPDIIDFQSLRTLVNLTEKGRSDG